ncbi:MAG: serine hydrolase [Verrucomicrobiota bacterium]
MKSPSASFLAFRFAVIVVSCCAWTSTIAQPTISSSPRSQFAWEGKRIKLSVTATGSAPVSYQWQMNGINLVDSTNRSLSISQARLADSGLYTVVVSDPEGTKTSDAGQVLVRSWPKPTGPRIPELARLDTNMQTVLLNHGIPGGSLAVVKDGRLVFARGYGWANVEGFEQFYPDSMCQIASLSKTITAAAVMKLVDEGRLDLTNRAFSLLTLQPAQYPGATNDSRLTNITVRQLLNHTAGWVSSTAKNPLGGAGFDGAFWPVFTMQELGIARPATPTEFVRWMMGKPLQAIPGRQYAYSNVGFLVAGRVVEAITGQSFETVARQLLAQAGITRTRLGRNTLVERFPSEAVCYLHPSITGVDIVGQDNWAEPKPLDSNLPYAYPLTTLEAAGGFVASAIDHARLVAAIDGLASFPDILTTNSVSAMASDVLGWDNFLSSGTDPQTGIWGKLGVLPGAIAKAVKWRNGVIFVYLLNSWEKEADPELYDRLTGSFASGPWPTNDLFSATLSYEAWRGAHFSVVELSDPLVSGEQADPDGDGLPNLMEYSQGLNPRRGNEQENSNAHISANHDGMSLIVSFRRLLLAHELDYQLEASGDFQAWSPAGGQETETSLNADGTITVSSNVGTVTAPIASCISDCASPENRSLTHIS